MFIFSPKLLTIVFVNKQNKQINNNNNNNALI